MPYSKLKAHVADILKAEGYIASWKVRRRGGRQEADARPQVRPEPRAFHRGIKRVSKPGLRVYAKSTELRTVLGGLGVAILSTSSGLLTDRRPSKKGVGGEVLAYVW